MEQVPTIIFVPHRFPTVRPPYPLSSHRSEDRFMYFTWREDRLQGRQHQPAQMISYDLGQSQFSQLNGLLVSFSQAIVAPTRFPLSIFISSLTSPTLHPQPSRKTPRSTFRASRSPPHETKGCRAPEYETIDY